MSQCHVSALFYYPVKSLAGIALQSAEIEALGIRYDRRWMVVDTSGRFVTQRQHPQMALIQVLLDNGHLKLSHALHGAVMVPDPQEDQDVQVDIWDSSVTAWACHATVDTWLSEVLGISCRLVYFSETSERQIDTAFAQAGEQVAFADGFPLLVVNEATLEALNAELAMPVPVQRFRPNIVLKGAQSLQEHQWQTLTIGDCMIDLVKPCSRCVMTTVDHQRGIRTSNEPFATLQRFNNINGKAVFGMNALCRKSGVIHVGDVVEIKTRK
ncbi:MOSC domain-containing protein [Marinicella sp. W31]|uniref:MOSC domain-containing protein n=1 Tax=Marinicella sp. W31 TaxID=3023713 RepID=UPI00375674C2